MPAKINILFLVKNLHDAKEILDELNKIYLDYRATIVQGREQFKNALKGPGPDLILADYQVADVDGIDALLIQEIVASQAPLILLGDPVGEDNAIKLMKMGIADYVRKENLHQLGPSVQKTLQIAGLRKQKKIARQQLRKKVIQVSKIMDLSLDVICTLDQEGRFVTVGAASKRVWAFLPQELMGRKAIDLIEEADKKRTYRAIEGLRQGLPMVNFENRFIRKDGTMVFLSWSVRWDAQEQLAYAVVRDISKMKQTEEIVKHNEKRFRTLLQNSTDGLCLLSADGRVIERSPSALTILGLDSGEVSGNFRLDLLHPDDSLTMAGVLAQIKENPQESLTIECRFQQSDGRYKWLETTFHNQLKEPAVEAIVLNFRDITERKAAELVLRESEAKLKKAQAIGHCGNWEMNLVNGQEEWSDELYRILGIEGKEMQASFDTFVSFIHPEDRSGALKIFEKASNSCKDGTTGFRIQPLNGGIRYVISEWQFEVDANGEPVRIFGILQDITQTKLAEIALTTSEARLKQAQAIGHMGNGEINLTNGHIIWSDELYHIYGLDPSKTVPSMEVFESILHPEDRLQVLNFFMQVTSEYRDGVTTFRIRRPDGEVRFVVSEWHYEFNALGKPIKLFGIVQDVTERSLAERALALSETKYRDLFNLSPIPKWLFDVETLKFLDVNIAAVHHYGYSREEFLAMSLNDIRPQEDLKEFQEKAKNFKSTSTYLDIVKHIKKSGEVIDVEIKSNYVEVGGQKARLVLATDISERIKHMDAIQQQNAKLKEIAWTQSHVVRAPLARLMGLVDLLRSSDAEVVDVPELLDSIAVSAHEMDYIIREIVQNTEAVNDQSH